MKAVIDGKLYDTETAELLFLFDDKRKTGKQVFGHDLHDSRRNHMVAIGVRDPIEAIID